MLMAEALIECANGSKKSFKVLVLLKAKHSKVWMSRHRGFWHSLAKNGGGNKDTYIVWNVFPNTPLVRADDSSKRWRSSALMKSILALV